MEEVEGNLGTVSRAHDTFRVNVLISFTIGRKKKEYNPVWMIFIFASTQSSNIDF